MTNSNHQILSTLDKLRGDHYAILSKVKDRISLENAEITKIKEKNKNLLAMHESHQKCTPECRQELSTIRKEEYEFKKSTHPGSVISFDNLDFQLQRKSMTMQSRNRDFHWVNHQMVENRMSGPSLIPSNRKLTCRNYQI